MVSVPFPADRWGPLQSPKRVEASRWPACPFFCVCYKGTRGIKAHKSNINITDYKLKGHVCKELSSGGYNLSRDCSHINTPSSPAKKPPTEIERIWQGYRKARFHYLQGKTERKRESVKSSRNINYTQDKYTAIRHVHTIKIFVSCNYRKFRWDTERYTMNFLILLKLADEWLAQECYMILKVECESDFYTDYDGRVLIRQIISLRYDVYRLSGLF